MSWHMESAVAAVEVAPNVTIEGGTVGVITMSKEGKGWTQLTPDEADQLGVVLIRAAAETRRASGGAA